MAIFLNLNFNIAKERKMPFFWCIYIYICLWMHLDMHLHAYTYVLWSILCFRVFFLCYGRFERKNSVKITQIFLLHGCLRSNKDLQLWLKLWTKMKRLLVCKRTPKFPCIASQGIFTNYNLLAKAMYIVCCSKNDLWKITEYSVRTQRYLTFLNKNLN